MPNIFSDNQEESNEEINVTLEDLVGDTQKYKTVEDLAKAYAHADAHIAKVTQKLVEAEAERKVLKDLVESNRKNSNTPPNNEEEDEDERHEPPARNRSNNSEDDNEKDLSERIREVMEESKSKEKFSSNVNTVSEKMAQHFGGANEARRALESKAKELSVSVDWLMDIAGRSPASFYNIVGVDQRSFSTPGVNSDVNTAAFGKDRNRKNFAYYEEIRKTDPRTYYSAQVRKEMLASAREQGEKFYT